MDLPFAEKRFCESFNIGNIDIGSDFRYRDLEKYGVLISEGALKGILARAVFIVDPEGKVCYKQIVPEITEEPNYDEVINLFYKLNLRGFKPLYIRILSIYTTLFFQIQTINFLSHLVQVKLEK